MAPRTLFLFRIPRFHYGHLFGYNSSIKDGQREQFSARCSFAFAAH
jgi:hypothetical protein